MFIFISFFFSTITVLSWTGLTEKHFSQTTWGRTCCSCFVGKATWWWALHFVPTDHILFTVIVKSVVIMHKHCDISRFKFTWDDSWQFSVSLVLNLKQWGTEGNVVFFFVFFSNYIWGHFFSGWKSMYSTFIWYLYYIPFWFTIMYGLQYVSICLNPGCTLYLFDFYIACRFCSSCLI